MNFNKITQNIGFMFIIGICFLPISLISGGACVTVEKEDSYYTSRIKENVSHDDIVGDIRTKVLQTMKENYPECISKGCSYYAELSNRMNLGEDIENINTDSIFLIKKDANGNRGGRSLEIVGASLNKNYNIRYQGVLMERYSSPEHLKMQKQMFQSRFEIEKLQTNKLTKSDVLYVSKELDAMSTGEMGIMSYKFTPNGTNKIIGHDISVLKGGDGYTFFDNKVYINSHLNSGEGSLAMFMDTMESARNMTINKDEIKILYIPR